MKKLLFCMLSVLLVGCGSGTDNKTSGLLKTYDALFFDFGEALVDAEDVSKKFSFQNDSRDELVITAINSSCGCTKGYFSYEGYKSPIFSMDAPLIEPIKIPGNTDFQVTVQYNPGYHGPDNLGERDQTFYFVTTSEQNTSTPTRLYPLDGESALTEIKVTGNVVASLEAEELVE